MNVTFRIPTILRTYTEGESNVSVDLETGTLQDALDALEASAPGIMQRLVADTGELRRFINIYVNDDDVRFLDGLGTVLAEESLISIVPAVAGG